MNNTYSWFYIEIDAKYSNLECKITKRINPVVDLLLDGSGEKTEDRFIDRFLMIKTNAIAMIRYFITKDIAEKYINCTTLFLR